MNMFQKQPPRGVPWKKCSKNIQQIYRRIPMPKCDFDFSLTFSVVKLSTFWHILTLEWLFHEENTRKVTETPK